MSAKQRKNTPKSRAKARPGSVSHSRSKVVLAKKKAPATRRGLIAAQAKKPSARETKVLAKAAFEKKQISLPFIEAPQAGNAPRSAQPSHGASKSAKGAERQMRVFLIEALAPNGIDSDFTLVDEGQWKWAQEDFRNRAGLAKGLDGLSALRKFKDVHQTLLERNLLLVDEARIYF